MSNTEKVSSMSDTVTQMNKLKNNEFYYPGFEVGKPDDEVAIIIDGANLSHVVKTILKGAIDYRKLSQMFNENFPGLRQTNFIIMEYTKRNVTKHTNGREYKHGYSPIRGLLDYLKNNRYKVTSKTVMLEEDQSPYSDGVDFHINMDVEITSALYKAARFAKHIVFIGGDEKYHTPLQDLHNQGHTITVIGAKHPDRSTSVKARYTADVLREIDNFVDLQDPFFKILLKPARERIYTDRQTEVMPQVDESTD